MASNIKVTFLGTGGSWPSPGRGMPAVAVQVDEILNLFDCGEGTQKQIMKSNLSFMKIRNVFITHFHGDHFLGLIGLIQSMSFNGREEPLDIYGPFGAIQILSNALSIGYYTLTFRVRVHELEAGKTYDLEKFEISTLKNDHPVPCISYKLSEKSMLKIDGDKAAALGIPSRKLERLRSEGTLEHGGRVVKLEEVLKGKRPGRKIVYTGDTRPMDTMSEFAYGADVFIHDTTTDSSFEPKVNEFGHSSSRQAAEIAKKAEVKKLFLYHFSPRIEKPEVLLNEAKAIFEETYLSRELLEVEVKASKEIIPL